ncbi:MAG: tetratricopeptide repeat protein [Acidobacteria bacterium]|nr:tetratricopeptide repeat protein [Acidobacteriota bacterium]
MFWAVFFFLVVCLPDLRGQSRESEIAAHIRLAGEANARQDLETAAAEYGKVIVLEPRHAEAHARLGMVYQNLGRLPEAVGALEKAIEIDPGLPRVGVLLAFSYMGLGKNREAIPQLEKAFAVEDEPAMRSVVGQRLVECYFAVGDEENGLAVVDKLRRLAPDDPDVLYTASKVYANLWNTAVQRMLAKAAASYRVHQVLAEVFEAQEKYGDAAKEYRQIIRMEPQLPGMHYRLGRMILRSAPGAEADSQALTEFEKELEINRFDAATHSEIGEVHLRAERTAEALRYFSRAAELRPSYAPARVGLAKVFLAQKEFSKAVKQLEAASLLAPQDEAIPYNLMVAYRSLGRVADAKQAFDSFQKLKAQKQQNQASILNQLKGVPIQGSGKEP